MTRQEIEAALKVCEGATPGEWRTGPINYADIYGPDGEVIALVTKGRTSTGDDAKLILLARTILEPALHALLERHEDSERLDWLIEHRAELWNRQYKDRAAIDAARKTAPGE